MIDPNALQGFTQTEGTTNFLPPIQGNTQVLPAISSGTDTILQQTAGLGQADANGFFGATTNTNEIFGDTLKTETNDIFGGQTIQGTTTNYFGAGTTTDTNTLFGTTQVLPATTDPNTFFNNQTLTETQFLPGTTTNANAIYGTTQVLPNTTTFGTQGITTTTTTATYGTTLTQGEYPATIGSNDFKPGFTGITTTTTDGFGTNGPTTTDAPIGYGTTAADWAAFTTTQTTPQIETTNIQPAITNQFTFTETQPITEAVTTQVETIPQPQPQPVAIPPPQPVVQTPVPQPIQIQQPIPQTQFAARIIDEDFRRGRPIYNDFKTTGLKIQQPSNHNLPIRPSYNVGINRNPQIFNYGYNNTGFSRLNNVNTGLDRLGRGGSYDVYGRGITPLLNRAGLNQVNPTVQTTSRINDFL